MTHKAFNVILCLALLAGMVGFIPTSVVQAAEPEPETTAYSYATDHLIVKLRAEARVEKGTTSTHIASLDRALAGMQAAALEAVPGLPATYRVKLESKSADILKAVDTLNNDPAVEYAEPDYLAKFAAAPDDPRYSEQWGLAKVQAEGAWDETQGSPTVVIAIVDSGIDLTHEDLAPNLWVNPGEIPDNSLDDDNNGLVDDVQGWNFVNGTNDVSDFIGHGSLVAGVAAAKTNNTLGIAGMCGNCRIMPVKITQISGFANYSDIAAGVNYAAEKGAKVINLSVGGYADSITVKNAINAALSKGIVVVGGVGNDNKSDPFYPAAYEGVIAVAGTDESDVRVTSSNYGAWVDISAPGQNILSTTLGDYASDTGTSYATPFVSGAAGLLLSLHPEWTPAMVRSQFMHTTDNIDSTNPGFVGMLGSGRLNAALATQPSHPILTYKTYAGNGTAELRPDFGSTVALNVTLYNDWADAAGVTGTLSSTDPYVTITTAEADFGTILAGASQANAVPFSFDIAAAAGYNYALPFELNLSADGGTYTTVVNFTITTRTSEELVSGTIDADTTWTNDKTYKVTGDVGVAPGFTLTIEPGTVVKFAGNFSLNLGGTLIAQGTAAQPIHFEPYTVGEKWNRIFLGDTSLDAVTDVDGVYQSGNILQYVNLTGATGGIACTNTTPFLDHVITDQGGFNCALGSTPLWLLNSNMAGSMAVTAGVPLVGTFDTPGEARDVAISNGYAYISDGASGLRILDISNPVVPIEIGAYDTPGDAYDVAISGNYAYIADGSALRVVDVSDPTNPVEVGFYETLVGSFQKVVISGTYAYVSNTSGPIHILDISNPAAPAEVGLIPTIGVLTSLAVSGSYAYVADHESGLRILDVSDPTNPVETGAYNPGGYAVDVAFSGEYVYILYGENYSPPALLHIVNVSDPTAPYKTGAFNTPGDAFDVDISGDYVYIIDHGERLSKINITNPANPVEVRLIEISGTTVRMSADDGYVYTAEQADGLGIYRAYEVFEASVSNTILQGETISLPQAASVLDSTIYGNFSAGGGSVLQGSTINGAIAIDGDGQVSDTSSGPLTINGNGDVQQATVTGSVTIAFGQVLDTSVTNGSISSGVNSTITNCVLSGGGISAGAGSTITRNNIENASGNGITTSGTSTITFNRVAGAGQGINASAGMIENNLVANTTGDGLHPGTASVRNNTLIVIAGNGVLLDQVPTAFEYNNFEFNTGTYDVYVAVPLTTIANLDAQNNWWGTTDSAVIKLRTWDYYDDFNLAKLIAAPVLTAPSPTAPGYVRSVTLDPAGPVGIQTVDFTVEFSRPMDVSSYPDVTFGGWAIKTDIPTPRRSLAAVTASNGKIYVIGGDYSSFGLKTVEEYNPSTDTWATKADMPTQRYGMSAVATGDGKIYVFGGSPGPGFTTVEIYDTQTNTWHYAPDMPTGKSGAGAVVANDGNIYIVGGWSGSNSWLNTVEVYDPITQVWQTKAGLATGRYNLGLELANNGKIYAIGGASAYDPFTKVEEYDPVTNIWSDRTPMPSPRFGLNAIKGCDGRIYAIGGRTHYDVASLKTIEVYDPIKDMWNKLPDMPSGRNAFGAVLGNNCKIYIFGGGGTESMVTEYTPAEQVNENPHWIDPYHFQTSYEVTIQNGRGDYRLSVTNANDGDGTIILPDDRTTFTVDYAGEISDTTPPSQPTVSAWGNGTLSQLSAQATADDPDSVITGYRYAIGTTEGGADVINWTNTVSPEITRSGLLLQPDQPYYVSFQARNVSGLWSPIGVSNAVVNGVIPNEPPVVVDDSYSMNEDATLDVATPGVLGNDTDADSNPLTAILITGPAHGALTLNADGSFTYVPTADWNGSDSFTYQANDGMANSNVATVTLTITAINDPPVAANDSYTTDEDTPLNVAAPGVLGNDTDVEGSVLTAIKVTDPDHGTLTLNANGSFTYAPNANWNGADSFTYKVNDGTLDSIVATVTLTITAVNDPPVVNDQSVSTPQDKPLNITLTASDMEGNALTWTVVNSPAHGDISGMAPNITYTPAAGWHGSDSFTFKVNDGTVDSNTATVSIIVTQGNVPPVAVNDSYSMNEDAVLTITAPGVLGNDTDEDSDPMTALLVTGPAHGTLTLKTNGSFTYTPDANWHGAETFTYKANDGDADSNVATVTITVAGTPETKSIYLPLIYR